MKRAFKFYKYASANIKETLLLTLLCPMAINFPHVKPMNCWPQGDKTYETWSSRKITLSDIFTPYFLLKKCRLKLFRSKVFSLMNVIGKRVASHLNWSILCYNYKFLQDWGSAAELIPHEIQPKHQIAFKNMGKY